MMVGIMILMVPMDAGDMTMNKWALDEVDSKTLNEFVCSDDDMILMMIVLSGTCYTSDDGADNDLGWETGIR